MKIVKMVNATKMKTGKHYFGLLTEEEQRNFRQACEEQHVDFKELLDSRFANFKSFVEYIVWSPTSQGYKYWNEVAMSNRDEQHIEFKVYNHKQPLATFRLIFIYSVIVFLVMCLLLVIHTASYKQGYKIGYRNGIEKVDSIVNYEELTPESVEAVQKLQLNTTRINENRPKR